MGRYQAYPEYKDSGVQWIGQIPLDWKVIPLKRVASLRTGLTPSTENQDNYEFDETEFSWVRPEDLDESGQGVKATKFLSAMGWSLMRPIPSFSTLVCCIGTIGKLGYVERVVATNQQITAATFAYAPKFNFYLLQSARKILEQTATGNVIQILNSERLSNIDFLLLPKLEAEKIANFLDHETAKIDTLIEQQQQLIQLLKEKRQAVISHAVTKGLNPDAPMKDSGVEWLGEVPAHWEVWKFGHFAPIITCGIASTPTYVDEDVGMPFLSAQNVQNNKLSLHKYNFIPKELHEQLTRYRKPERGDILVTRVGAGIGDACVIDIDMEFSIYVSLTHIRVNPDVAFNKFIMYFFSTDYCHFLNHQGTVTGGGVGNLNVQNVIRYNIPLPSLAEQSEIVSHIESMSANFERLIVEAEKSIQLANERRTALISAAVTGKIDVRSWQAPNN